MTYILEGQKTSQASVSINFPGSRRLRCGRASAPGAEVREASSRQITVEGEVGADGEVCPSLVRSRGLAFLARGLADRRRIFEGVEGLAQPSQRPGRLGVGVVIGVAGAAAETGLGR